MKEYKIAAKKADQRYYNTDSGPITQRLVQIGPILPASFGRLGEAGEPVHKLVSVMAQARVNKQTLAWGRGEEAEEIHLSVETGYLRQRISSAVVTCFGQRLQSRMSLVGLSAIHCLPEEAAVEPGGGEGQAEQECRLAGNDHRS